MTAREYVRSDTWASRRALLHAEHGPLRCLVCDRGDHVELHHRHYTRPGMEEFGVDVVPLCEDHHREVERMIRTQGTPRYDAHLHYIAWIAGRRRRTPRQIGAVLGDAA